MEKVRNWARNNKVKIFVVGGATIIVFCGIRFFLNQVETNSSVSEKLKAANNIPQSTKLSIKEKSNSAQQFSNCQTKEVFVPMYCRNLPVGQHASVKKVIAATEAGIKLKENQTLVSEFCYERRVVS